MMHPREAIQVFQDEFLPESDHLRHISEQEHRIFRWIANPHRIPEVAPGAAKLRPMLARMLKGTFCMWWKHCHYSPKVLQVQSWLTGVLK